MADRTLPQDPPPVMTEDDTFRLMVATIAAGILANTPDFFGPGTRGSVEEARAHDAEIAERATRIANEIDDAIEERVSS